MIYKLFEKNEIYKSLTNGEKNIYDYISKNWKFDDLMKVQNIANNCFCSTTSVQRFINKLGFSSFSEFKVKAKEESNIKNNSIRSFKLEETLNNINEESLSNIIYEIKKHKNIYIYGTGASKISSLFLVRQLILLGFHASFIDDIHILKNINNGLFIPVSSSGSTQLTIDASLRAKNNGLTVCSITKKGSLLDQVSKSSFTHNVIIQDLDYIEREIQLHLFLMISQIADLLRD